MTTLIYQPLSRTTQVSCYQNYSILKVTGAKDDGDGGDNWSYKNTTCKTPQTVTTNKPTLSLLLADSLPVTQ